MYAIRGCPPRLMSGHQTSSLGFWVIPARESGAWVSPGDLHGLFVPIRSGAQPTHMVDTPCVDFTTILLRVLFCRGPWGRKLPGNSFLVGGFEPLVLVGQLGNHSLTPEPPVFQPPEWHQTQRVSVRTSARCPPGPTGSSWRSSIATARTA